MNTDTAIGKAHDQGKRTSNEANGECIHIMSRIETNGTKNRCIDPMPSYISYETIARQTGTPVDAGRMNTNRHSTPVTNPMAYAKRTIPPKSAVTYEVVSGKTDVRPPTVTPDTNSQRAKTPKRKRHGRKDGGNKVNVKFLILIPLLVVVVAALASIWVITDGRPFDKVAATIGTDYRLYEDDVTDYVQTNRKHLGIEANDDWKSWLESNNYTVTDVREQTIQYFVRHYVIEQECKKQGITITDADVDADIQDTKGAYGYTDEAWEEQLSSMGYDDTTYRQDVYDKLMSKRLMEKLTTIADGNIASDTLIGIVNNNNDAFKVATRVSCIVLRTDETDKANDIKARLNADPTQFDSIKQSDSETTLYDGWTLTSRIASNLTDSVTGLNVGDISDPITLDTNGVIVIARVDEKANVEGDLTALDQLPQGLIDSMTETLAESGRETKLSGYIDNLVSKTNVHTNDIDVTTLPYYIDVNISNDSNANVDGTNETNANADASDSNATITNGADAAAQVSGQDATVNADTTVPEATGEVTNAPNATTEQSDTPQENADAQ